MSACPELNSHWMCRVNSRNAGRVRDHISNTHKVHCRKRTAAEKGKCKDVMVHELQHVYNRSSDDSLNKNYINRSASLYLVTRRCVSVYLGVVVLWVRYFEHALLQLKNCHHILPERTNPLLHLFAEPHSLYSMSQSTTKIVSFHDNVWKYAHLQCKHAWSQIAT